jgi:eukaryotic-like serine/threonine-protein kinase
MSTEPPDGKKTSSKDHVSKSAIFLVISLIFIIIPAIASIIVIILFIHDTTILITLISSIVFSVISCVFASMQNIQEHLFDTLPVLITPIKHLARFRKHSKVLRNAFFVLAVFALGASTTLFIPRLLKWFSTFGQTPSQPQLPLSAVSINDDPLGSGPQWIGISEGKFAFDTYADRPGASLKQQAVEALKDGNISFARELLQQAIQQDSNDAEALIYLENQRVLDSGSSYITFVIVTMLSGTPNSYNVGRDNLQGAYVAQYEYNRQSKLPGNTQVRLLIANVGDQSKYASQVKDQILKLARDETQALLGIMGWPSPSQQGEVKEAIEKLGQAFLPMISPTAADDTFDSISQYFFRVCPSNREQVKVAVQYAKQQLHATKASIIYDPGNENSLNLADDFQGQFNDSTHRVVDKESYTLGNSEALPDYVRATLRGEPDLIYFAGGYPNDVGAVLRALPSSSVNVFGADTLYQASHYSDSTQASNGRLYFTAFSFPDTWENLKHKVPPFFAEYRKAFDPLSTHNHPNMNPYGFSRPDNDVMLSYDAMSTLLDASKTMLTSVETNSGPKVLQQDLENKKGSQKLQQMLTQMKARQGVSGLISFDNNGNVQNKTVVVLQIDEYGSTQIRDIQGKFT